MIEPQELPIDAGDLFQDLLEARPVCCKALSLFVSLLGKRQLERMSTPLADTEKIDRSMFVTVFTPTALFAAGDKALAQSTAQQLSHLRQICDESSQATAKL